MRAGAVLLAGVGQWFRRLKPCVTLGCAMAMTHAEAKPPVLSYLFPAGGQIGTSFDLKLEGSPEGEGKGAWVSCRGVAIQPAGKDKARAIIADDAPPGLHLIRTFNAEGASALRWFSVGTLPEIVEAEPNDDPSKAQTLNALPACINGRLEKSGDVDGFAFEAPAGHAIVAAVEAYALGSPIDAVLNLFDAQGVRIATAHDGRNLDPVLTFKAEKGGKHVLQIAGFAHPPKADERFAGGATSVYRLQITVDAAVTRVFPPVIALGAKSKVEVRGPNIADKDKTLEVDGSKFGLGDDVQLLQPPRGALWPVQVVASSAVPVIEKEPNNQPVEATRVSLPAVAAGTISAVGDVDRFVFAAKKGERIAVRVRSKSLGLPLDAALRIESADGKALASADDEGDSPDPALSFTAAVDGDCFAVVADLFGKGGEAHDYVIEIVAEKADFEVALTSASAITLEAGKSAELTAKVKRRGGFKEPLVAFAHGLPEGVFAEPASVDEKSDAVKLTLTAAATAPAASGPIQLAVFAKNAKPPVHRAAHFAVRGEEEKRGTTLCDESDQIWLTVKPAVPEAPKTTAPSSAVSAARK